MSSSAYEGAPFYVRTKRPTLDIDTLSEMSSVSKLAANVASAKSKLWNRAKSLNYHTFLLGTSSMQDMCLRMQINRYNKIEVSTTAKSLSIALTKIILLTSKLPVLNMNLHYHLSRKIMQQALVQTGPVSQFQERPSVGLIQQYRASKM
jgi:hypothetical protein